MDKQKPHLTTIKFVNEECRQILAGIEKVIVGKQLVLEKIMAALLSSGGHILLEDYPGLAKTLTANSFASTLGLDFKRIQFTPDLLPGDISGGFIFDSRQNQFILRKGPVFTNILLADEINRASPKTQSALLEAMQEYQISLEGESYPLPEPFIVFATQNPIEYEGTFPLPEAQLDRFMIRLSIGYPGIEEEQEILKRRNDRGQDAIVLPSVVDSLSFLAMRKAVEHVYVDPDLQNYIVQIATKTRNHPSIELGVSPRGSLALLKISKAWAALHGRDFVIPDDIKNLALDVFCHRIVLNPDLWGSKKSEIRILNEIIDSIPVPLVAERT